MARAGLLALMALALAPAGAAGETFSVNTTADGADFNTADPFCDADPVASGEQCTLRAALMQADTPPGRDTVELPSGTYTLDSPNELVVSSDVIVDGAGSASTTIRQQITGRVIRVDGPGGRLDLRDVTVRDGVIAADGGGIRNTGALVVRRSVVKANQAFGDGNDGGGIMNLGGGDVTILDSVIGDPAGGAAGNRAARGGGIFSDFSAGASLTVRRSQIVGNTALHSVNPDGGGIHSLTAPTVIEDSWIRANAGGVGGGANVQGGGGRLERTTISGNTSTTGALSATFGPVTLRNLTVSGNHVAPGGTASGVSLSFGTGGSTIANSTFAGNVPGAGGAADLEVRDTVTVGASIFASAGATGCVEHAPGGAIASAGFNLEAGTSCGLGALGDLQNASPGLGPLAENGGQAPTRALGRASPAIDRAAGCPPPSTDQRGVPRPQGVRCDSGAYERVRCAGVVVNRVGTPAADALVGTAGPDGFLLLAGNDLARGLGGNDAACGGPGADRFLGGAGRDAFLGGPGGDRFLGGPGRDRALGGAGPDRLLGQAGPDRLFGHAGNDRLLGGRGRDLLVGGSGRDVCHGGPGRDRKRGCERGRG